MSLESYDCANGALVSSEVADQSAFFANFDLTDSIFASMFPNVEPCQIVKPTSVTPTYNSEIFLLHLNIRSLQKNFDNFYNFLTSLPTAPHVISLTETNIKDKPICNISIPVYTFLHVNSLTNAGGVGVYINNNLHLKQINLSVKCATCKDIWMNITFPKTNTQFIVGTIYWNPNTCVTKLLEYLNEILIVLNAAKKHYFILGDINIHTLSSISTSTNNNNGVDCMNLLTSHCVASLVNEPTRVTATAATCLDHILTNENRYVLTPAVIECSITDHYPIMVFTFCKLTVSSIQSKHVRSLKKLSIENFNTDLRIELDSLSFDIFNATSTNINSVFDKFYSAITKTIDKHAPLKKLNRKQKRLQRKPWITKGLLISIKRKQKMHKSHFVHGSTDGKNFTTSTLTC